MSENVIEEFDHEIAAGANAVTEKEKPEAVRGRGAPLPNFRKKIDPDIIPNSLERFLLEWMKKFVKSFDPIKHNLKITFTGCRMMNGVQIKDIEIESLDEKKGE